MLSLLDLPEELIEHGLKSLEGRKAELKAAGNLILYQKEIRESKLVLSKNVQVTQRYMDISNANDEINQTDEFLVNHPYKTEVVFTNISSAALDLEILTQIPEGALPLGNSTYQKSHLSQVASYGSGKVQYMYYFPSPGKFAHFPANVTQNGNVIATANPSTLNVVEVRTKFSETSFKDVVASGNKNLILNFLKERAIETIPGFAWSNLYWLLTDKTFFQELIKLLREQRRFEPEVWAFSLLHKTDEVTLKEYFDSLDNIKKQLGYWFESELISVQPEDVGFQHLEYYPLINSRAHNIFAGQSSFTIHPQLYKSYKEFILQLAEKRSLSVVDKMKLTYYLILQERLNEGLGVFSRISSEKEIPVQGSLRLQYDYMAAYLDFFTGFPEFKVARQIMPKYISYPISRWRMLFLDIQTQLEEYDEKKIEITGEESKDKEEKGIIKEEPQLEAILDGKEIVLDYTNLKNVTLKYYLIDMETLFSRAPFFTAGTDYFSYIFPNKAETVSLDEKIKNVRINVNKEFIGKNVVIQVLGGGREILLKFFSASHKVFIYEKYGELQCTDLQGNILPRIYVKVFALSKSGKVNFYKDGYTDVRGRFDYLSLNASKLETIQKFAVLTMSETHGALIKECNPPVIQISSATQLEEVNLRWQKYEEADTKSKKCLKKESK